MDTSNAQLAQVLKLLNQAKEYRDVGDFRAVELEALARQAVSQMLEKQGGADESKTTG